MKYSKDEIAQMKTRIMWMTQMQLVLRKPLTIFKLYLRHLLHPRLHLRYILSVLQYNLCYYFAYTGKIKLKSV